MKYCAAAEERGDKEKDTVSMSVAHDDEGMMQALSLHVVRRSTSCDR